MRVCNECNFKKICHKYNNQINESEVIEANSNFLEREAPDQFGHMFAD